MKTVFNNRELCHVWAHKSQETGRGSNLFFTGSSIYSYGYHFEIARHVEHNGQSAVLFNTASYSPSTSKHQCYVNRAITHLKTFHVPMVLASCPKSMFSDYKDRFEKTIVKASRARTYREWHLRTAVSLATEGNELARFYGLKNRIHLPKDFNAMLVEAKKKEAVRIAQKAEETKRRNEENRRKAIEALEQWRNGQLNYLPYNWSTDLGGDCLRFSADGQTVQTTKGATVPTEHAHRAYSIMRHLKDRHEAYQRNGHTHHVGNYAIDRMDEQGELRIGCHTIQWEEVDRLATLAGWNNEPDNQQNGCEESNSGTHEVSGSDTIGTRREVEGSDSEARGT